MKLTIVIPLYNEELRIINTFPIINEHLNKLISKFNIGVELIFINDGSTDKTKKVVFDLVKKREKTNYAAVVVSYKKNMGKGFALKKGFKKASGDYILFMDADLSTPLYHIEEFLAVLKDNSLHKNTILIGSRKTKGSNVTKHQTFLRETLGKGFTLLSNLLLVWGITDFTCGFKMFPKKIGKHLFLLSKIHRWGFDSEILYLARKNKYPILELPVSWSNDSNTKVNLRRDIYLSLLDIFKIRFTKY